MTGWRDVVDGAALTIGPLAPALARHWRTELDDVERRVADLERTAPAMSDGDGVYAFVTLASARLGDAWEPRQLIDVAAAVELAYRATRHHAAVVNAAFDAAASAALASAASHHRRSGRNTAAVLDGDWSITQAALLVSDVGPTAYRILVRGYGATQLATLSSDSDPLALMHAAVALGGLVAGVPDKDLERLWDDAGDGRAHRSAEAAALAWAVARQSPVSRVARRSP